MTRLAAKPVYAGDHRIGEAATCEEVLDLIARRLGRSSGDDLHFADHGFEGRDGFFLTSALALSTVQP